MCTHAVTTACVNFNVIVNVNVNVYTAPRSSNKALFLAKVHNKVFASARGCIFKAAHWQLVALPKPQTIPHWSLPLNEGQESHCKYGLHREMG